MSRALLVLLALVLSLPAVSDPAAERLLKAGFDQRLGARLPLQAAFRDERGQAVRVGDYFRDARPVVLVFAYYHCPNLCDSVLAAAFSGLARTGYRGGKDFELVVIGIDPRETPADAGDKKTTELQHFPFAGGRLHAHFLTGDRPAIDAVAGMAGFRYVYDAQLDQFAHAAGLLVATPTGVVSRYLFGMQFKPEDLRLALVEASGNKVGPLADKLLLLCSHYDPQTGSYGVAIMNVLRLAGGALVLALAGFVFVSVRRERRRDDVNSAGASS